METRANFLLIGIFTVLGVLGAFGFFIWLAKVQVDQRYAYYEVVFDSVSGLSRSGDVRFSGLSVGKVISLELYSADPSKVAALIEIAAETPVRADTMAQLQTQGLTGVAFVSLTGGTSEAALLAPAEDGALPVLFAERSAVQALTEDAPDLMIELTALMRSLGALASPENQLHVTSFLANLDQATVRLAELVDNGNAMLTSATSAVTSAEAFLKGDVAQAVAELRSSAQAFGAMAETIDAEAPAITEEARTALARATAAISRMDRDVAAITPSIRAFSTEGLPQYTKLARDARDLVDSLKRLSSRMGRDPARFLFGDRPREFGR